MRNGTKGIGHEVERTSEGRLGRIAHGALWVSALSFGCLEPGPGPDVSTEDPAPLAGQNDRGSGSPPPGSPAPGASAPAPVAPAEPSAPVAPVPMDVVLDDFEDGDGQLSTNGFSGAWRTYSDGTGQVTPAVDTPIVPVDGVVQVTGSGFTEWGVGLAVDLNGAGMTRAVTDLAAFRGLSIRARGAGTITVEVATLATTGPDEGGTCIGDGCFGHHAGTITLGAEVTDHELPFADLGQPEWAQSVPLDLTQVLAINFLSRSENGGAIDLALDSVTLLAAPPVATAEPGGVVTGPVPLDGSNPFAGRELHSEGGSAYAAYEGAQGAERDLLAKVALNPSAFWLTGGDPGRAGAIVDGAGGAYTVLVAYNIPDRDCSGQSAGGAGSADEYRGWIDGMSSSLSGKQAAVILEPDSIALSCGDSREELLAHAVTSLRQNPGVAVYLDGGHSNWVPADQMAGRLRAAGIEQATGFALNVSNFQPTDALVNYGRSLSGMVGGKPFVVDTSRNGQGGRGAEWCNPAGAGLGEAPTTNTGDPLVHALLWVKRPGESDGACGQCAGTPAGQFCTSYALELAQNAVF